MTGKTRGISPVPIHLSISSPNVVNLTLVDLPGLTKIAIDGQSDSIVSEIENMVRSYVSNPNTIILAVSPANQDLATSDAMKLAREMDPTGETPTHSAFQTHFVTPHQHCMWRTGIWSLAALAVAVVLGRVACSSRPVFRSV